MWHIHVSTQKVWHASISHIPVCALQPAVFALVCFIFRVKFSEVDPPVHPKTDPDHMVLPIEESCFQNPVMGKAGGELLTVSASDSSNNGSTAFKIEAQAPKTPKTPKTDVAVNAMPLTDSIVDN